MSQTVVIVLRNNTKAIIGAVSADKLKKAAHAGGEIIQTHAMLNVNQKFSSKSVGAAGLGGSIKVLDVSSSKTSAWVDVGPTVIYGRIQELGGIVKPVFAKMLSWVDNGQRIFAKMVQIPARPYLRPAVDENMDKIEQAVGYQIKKQIEQVAQ